jgi:8-oxo-dGTP pyrophosphatase MutT (NUDIX family)
MRRLAVEPATLADIAGILAHHPPALLDLPDYTRAAVALILHAGTRGLEVLFMERAPRAGDPWSGDLGFPGGKVEEADRDPRQSAERETREEIGLDLRDGRYLGRLSDIAGAHLPVQVSCFVYGVGDPPPFELNEEVRDLFWVALADLRAPARHVAAPVRFGGEIIERPAIRLPQPGKPVLWGITYRLVMQFLELLGSSKPVSGQIQSLSDSI